MTSTERAIAEHLACAPIGMLPEALAHELWALIGPEVTANSQCAEDRKRTGRKRKAKA